MKISINLHQKKKQYKNLKSMKKQFCNMNHYKILTFLDIQNGNSLIKNSSIKLIKSTLKIFGKS